MTRVCRATGTGLVSVGDVVACADDVAGTAPVVILIPVVAVGADVVLVIRLAVVYDDDDDDDSCCVVRCCEIIFGAWS